MSLLELNNRLQKYTQSKPRKPAAKLRVKKNVAEWVSGFTVLTVCKNDQIYWMVSVLKPPNTTIKFENNWL